METKKRQSLDGTSPGSGSSAFRRLTRSPNHRLSLRRSSIESTTSSVAVSVSSDDSEASSSACVTRDTARDECALHRFIVWTAVKRNACDKMSAQEKLECPMLRCRKRSPSHELMLQHLYSCDWLAAGEYWCYECAKPERFNDAKCKRCLGHPSRRRKIMSMAKTFFSSLGHKSRNSNLSDFDLDIEDVEAPPSYDSAVAPPQVELHSNEIHEIDSSEIALHTIMEEEAEADTVLAPISITGIPPLPVQPLPASHLAELESGASIGEPLIDWITLSDTVAPVNLIDPGIYAGTERPALHLHTADLEEYRRQQKRRSKGAVVPSISVRSTASTNSTSSTNTALSMLSTTSISISPVSEWSGTWARTTGFESTLTSPADDLAGPGGLLRADSFAFSPKASTAKDWGTFDDETFDLYHPSLSELPADMPMSGALSADDSLHDPLEPDQPVFTLNGSSLPTEFPLGSNLALTDNSHAAMAPSVSPTLGEPTVGYHHDPRSLVGTAWDALEMHVAETMAKLQQMSKNHLVGQLRNMSAYTIALNGLETLTDVLEGRYPTAPVKLLCFVHLVYCFSLVVHEQDAPSRSTDLFGQALSYSTWFSRQDRQLYLQIVDALWKPAAMTEPEVFNLVQAKVSPSVSRSSSLKGKERESASVQQSSSDSLAFVARYFLDQLEYATVHMIDESEIQSSNLYMQHLGDPTMVMHGDSSFAIAANFMLKHNFQQYANVTTFAASLNDLVQRVNANAVSTLRRLELELMHVGKMFLPSDHYFDHYVNHVRNQMDLLYQDNPQENSRSTYYRHGVKLIEIIVNRLTQPAQPILNSTPQETTLLDDELDRFIEGITPLQPFDFDPAEPFNSEPAFEFPNIISNVTIDPGTLNPQLLPTPKSVRGSSTSPASPAPAPLASTSASKVKSNSSCEICGYRPEGDPRWFGGSMAKHKKLQHATSPPKIYRCPFPGCTSQYKNRPDNLRQHQIEKGHFLEGQDPERRPSKRRKVE
ncbi:hypothetical protein FZEAL_6362 [Fusarium zealandicum]|uniref:Uncharacterized protein n=1 Tax=Fusarium zealandicum TaxID=1053134 RepID=A0A8H4UHY5_9HYPO|nr:hypothetical protein FZEAL_6362 [Fusarium zealandicum]